VNHHLFDVKPVPGRRNALVTNAVGVGVNRTVAIANPQGIGIVTTTFINLTRAIAHPTSVKFTHTWIHFVTNAIRVDIYDTLTVTIVSWTIQVFRVQTIFFKRVDFLGIRIVVASGLVCAQELQAEVFRVLDTKISTARDFSAID
jgi:hypothetical protein